MQAASLAKHYIYDSIGRELTNLIDDEVHQGLLGRPKTQDYRIQMNFLGGAENRTLD